MNILTFDVEDWYNCDFISRDYDWSKYEVRIHHGVDSILTELEDLDLKATFLCLGWIAEKHPDVVRKIYTQGHHIGCHSYQHELVSRTDRKDFISDTKKAKQLIEDCIGEKINTFRAPGFSISQKNLWAFEELVNLGFEIDCSIFPASHDYGGFKDYNISEPLVLKLPDGRELKEFPMTIHSILGKRIVFSGGGFFRFFPYIFIKHWALKKDYLMTYFHPRDFDPDQPILTSLPPIRKFKSYVGLKRSFKKFQKLLRDFDFISIQDADKIIDWSNSKKFEVDF